MNQDATTERTHGLSAPALVIGIIGAAAACFVVCWAELVVKSIQIAICQFAPAAIGLLLLVVVINGILSKLAKRRQIGRAHV